MRGVAVGLALGLAIGGLTHGLLVLVRSKSDRIFYGVWGGGFFFRLLAAASLVWYLIVHPVLPLIPTILGLLAAQLGVQMLPIRPSKGGSS